MMIYQKSTNTMESYDYRETAPGRSKMDMFKKEPEKSRTGNIISHFTVGLSTVSTVELN